MKTFHIRHKLIFFAVAMTLLIFVCNINIKYWPLAVAALSFFYFFCSFGDMICLTTYLCIFSGISQIYVSGIILTFIFIAARYIKDVISKQKPFFVREFTLTTLIILIFSIIHTSIDIEGFFNWGMFVALFYSIYFIFIYYTEIDVERCFKSLFQGLVVSVLLSVIAVLFGSLHNVIYPFDGLYNRLRMFTYNVNQLSIFCLFEIAYLCHKVVNEILKPNNTFVFFKDKNFWFIIIQILFCSLIGILTLSKAFLVLLFICFMYVMIYLIIRYKAKSLKIIIPALIILLMVLFIERKYIYKIIFRFFSGDTWNGLLSKIFTGRTEIWSAYLENISNSILSLLFGVGLMSSDLIAIGPHNVIIYFLYRVGLVGIILIAVLISFYFKDSEKTIKIRYRNCLLLVCYILLSLEEMMFSDRFFLFLIFSLILTMSPKRKIKYVFNKHLKLSKNKIHSKK